MVVGKGWLLHWIVDGQAVMLVLWDGQAALMLVLAVGGRELDANVALMECTA